MTETIEPTPSERSSASDQSAETTVVGPEQAVATATEDDLGVPGRPIKVWLSLGARLILAGVLGAAGLLKVDDPDASVRAVSAYELLPYDVERIIGYGLPFVEIALAALLLVGLATRFAAATSGVLMLVFIAAVSSAWARGLSIDCGCFGGGGQVDPDQTAYVEEIARDIGLMMLAGWLVIFPASKYAVDR